MFSSESVDSVSSIARSSSAFASGTCTAETPCATGLMMPDFVRAISATVEPSRCVWSSAIGVKTATWPSATLVESHSPPMPTSITATSTGASAKLEKASTVSASK